tara:strand:+ start:265 stop:624 length:360 start_codon:yes stop_codon:yes gene_type:complete
MDLHKCKSVCENLEKCCHNTKNRVIEKMIEANIQDSRVLSEYLKHMMCLESLCGYICTCCCEAEKLSKSIQQELRTKCADIVKVCNKICSTMDCEEYLNCKKMIELCNSCKTGKKTKRR